MLWYLCGNTKLKIRKCIEERESFYELKDKKQWPAACLNTGDIGATMETLISICSKGGKLFPFLEKKSNK